MDFNGHAATTTLADLYRERVLEHPRILEEIERFADIARVCGWEVVLAGVVDFIPVRSERISDTASLIVRKLEIGPARSAYNGPKIDEPRKNLNSIGVAALKCLMDELREGVLVAEGQIEPPTHDLKRSVIPSEWWSKRGTSVSFARGVLTYGDRTQKRRPMFSGITVSTNVDTQLIPPNSNLLDALLCLARPENRNDLYSLHKKSIYELLDGVDTAEDTSNRKRKRYSRIRSIDKELRAQFQRLLADGVYQLRAWKDLGTEPIGLPRDQIALLEFDYKESTVGGPGFSTTRVTVFPADSDLYVEEASNHEEGDVVGSQPAKPGRPSMKREICKAWEECVDEGLIDFDASQKKAINIVRTRVKRNKHLKDDWGLGDEAIRVRIAPLFRAELEKRRHRNL